MSDNPFMSLFDTGKAAPPAPSSPSSSVDISSAQQQQECSQLFESVFRLTLDRDFFNGPRSKSVDAIVYMGQEDEEENNGTTLLSTDNIDEIVLARLQITDRQELQKRLISSKKPSTSSSASSSASIVEPRRFHYLLDCYKRCKQQQPSTTATKQALDLCLNLSHTVVSLFDETGDDDSALLRETSSDAARQKFELGNLSLQLMFLLATDQDIVQDSAVRDYFDAFVNLIAASAETDDIDAGDELFLRRIFVYLNRFVLDGAKCDFFSADYMHYMDLVQTLTRHPLLKLLFVNSSFPGANASGRQWQVETAVGKLLTAHALPLAQPVQIRPQQQPFMIMRQPNARFAIDYTYFTKPRQLSKQDHDITRQNIWKRQQLLHRRQTELFYTHLLKGGGSGRLAKRLRHAWLEWLGQCVAANRHKMQEWSAMALDRCTSDGFVLNVMQLMLAYAAPFTRAACNPLLDKIDWAYASPERRRTRRAHFVGFDKDTKLVTASTDDAAAASLSMPPLSPGGEEDEFNFITECFFGTHQCVQLAYTSLVQSLQKKYQDLGRLQQQLQHVVDTLGAQNPQSNLMYEQSDQMTMDYLNIKTALEEPDLMKQLALFLASSCSWLTHLTAVPPATTGSLPPIKPYMSVVDSEETKQLLSHASHPSSRLSIIPEYFVTNASEFLNYVGRFKAGSLDYLLLAESDEQRMLNLNALVSFTLSYMDRADRLFNPHVRAALAECVEHMMAAKGVASPEISRQAFERHPWASQWCVALLEVFCSIEMYGQSVRFEEKFNYRRPIYELIEHLWKLETSHSDSTPIYMHREKMCHLAKEALENIGNPEQPLFLKFLNYLINDANYLLLEGLMLLEKIKKSQDKLAQDDRERLAQPGTSSATPLNANQREEIERDLKHMCMLARYHNTMSTKTIHTMRLLTSEQRMRDILLSDVLIDRVAVMLNDFLLHLVGKKQRKQLRVKDFKEVDFSPEDTVSTICDIYLNMACEEAFLKAICRDGRSYSAELFEVALQVLERIGRPTETREKFERMATRVAELAQIQTEEESNYDDAPEDFIDPIMSSLMVDPVMLPSSRQIVDRATIARILLSDQMDPFNRSPLTLQEVIPQPELKQQIEQWKASKRSKSS